MVRLAEDHRYHSSTAATTGDALTEEELSRSSCDQRPSFPLKRINNPHETKRNPEKKAREIQKRKLPSLHRIVIENQKYLFVKKQAPLSHTENFPWSQVVKPPVSRIESYRDSKNMPVEQAQCT